ncbi:MAG: metallophosphoesterase family protein [Ilumatobacteraceae bacterium]
MNVLLLADTHLREGDASRLIDRLGGHLQTADVIIHAGDITHPSVLTALEEYAPVSAVQGNNDRGMILPERLVVDIEGCEIAAVHDSGPAVGRPARLRRWFPQADVVVFGHSHIPWHETDVRASDGHVQHHVNPGSAMQRRAAPDHTAAVLELHDGVVAGVTHIVLP